MTDAEYAKKLGIACPFCGKTDEVRVTSPLTAFDGGASQGVRCANCKREWTDNYALIGYEEVPRG
jgi:transposase-like protein